MKYISIAAIALFLTACGEMSTRDVVNKVEDGTVYISNKIDATTGGSGTGFIVGDNMIVTNNHVIAGKNNKITVIGRESPKIYDAELVYTDEIADIAVIKLKDWNTFAHDQTPTILKFGNSNDTHEGDKVIIIGHPWGLSWTVSEGIISAKNRRKGPNPKYLDQVDAKIYQGNSGGPVFNANGEVVCVSELIMTGDGGSYGFCIPSNLVQKVVEDLKNFGEVRWRAMNVTIGLTDDGSSVILKTVEPGGAAGNAGLKENDKVVSVRTSHTGPDGKKIVRPDDLITELATLHGNDEDVRLTVDRNGQTLSFDVKTNYRLSKEYEPDKAK